MGRVLAQDEVTVARLAAVWEAQKQAGSRTQLFLKRNEPKFFLVGLLRGSREMTCVEGLADLKIHVFLGWGELSGTASPVNMPQMMDFPRFSLRQAIIPSELSSQRTLIQSLPLGSKGGFTVYKLCGPRLPNMGGSVWTGMPDAQDWEPATWMYVQGDFGREKSHLSEHICQARNVWKGGHTVWHLSAYVTHCQDFIDE